MTLVAPNVGELVMLKNITNNTAPQDLVLKLFTNNITPGESDVAGTYTEATGFGYGALTLSGASWGFASGNPSTASYAQQTFTFTGALGNVYGYYVVQGVSGILMWAELFTGGPFNIQNNGDQIKVTPQFTLE